MTPRWPFWWRSASPGVIEARHQAHQTRRRPSSCAPTSSECGRHLEQLLLRVGSHEAPQQASRQLERPRVVAEGARRTPVHVPAHLVEKHNQTHPSAGGGGPPIQRSRLRQAQQGGEPCSDVSV